MKIILTFFLLTFSEEIFAQEITWDWSNPRPTGCKLFDVTSINGTLWAVGHAGEMLRSLDSGKTWEHRFSYSTEDLDAIVFASSSHGWSVGKNGTVITTCNGGALWHHQTTPAQISSEELYAVDFVDEEHGWAGGTGGTMITTANGGETWAALQFPQSGVDISAIDFLDSLNGFVGADNAFFSTTDGGATWKTLGFSPSWDIRDILFFNNAYGFAVGGYGEVAITRDRGVTWKTNAVTGLDSILSIAMIDSVRGYIAGKGGKIFYTSDKGATWQEQLTPDANHLEAITVIGTSIAVACGGKGILERTENGSPWNSLQTDIAQGSSLLSISFVDSLYGWIGGWNGFMAKTTNGGKDWIKQNVANTTNALKRISFTSRLHGYAGGGQDLSNTNAKIFRTTNGGSTWAEDTVLFYNQGTLHQLRGLQFATDRTGFVTIDQQGTVVRTTDDGANWIPLQMGGTEFPLNLFALDSLTVFVPVTTSKIYKTMNGGLTWTGLTYTPASGMFAVYFVDQLYGWGVGNNGIIINTTDGGATWGQQTSNVSGSLGDIFFATRKIGWALAGSTILSTSDGGSTWASQPHPSTGYFSDVFALSPKNVFLVGTNSTILHSTNGGVPLPEPVTGEVSARPEVINYGTRKAASHNDTVVTITNCGNGALHVSSTTFRTGAYYSVVSGGAPFTLAPYASQPLIVRYAPLAAGEHRDTLLVTSNGFDTLQKIFFTGRGDTITNDVRETTEERSRIAIINYPNPFSRSTTIFMNGARGGTVKILDVYGRELSAQKITGEEIIFDAENLPAGMYFCRVEHDGVVKHLKMLKVK